MLTIDVGNTNTVIGLFEGDRLVRHWRIASDRQKTADEYGALLKMLFGTLPGPVGTVVLASVVPPLEGLLTETFTELFGSAPIALAPEMDLGIEVRVPVPREVGIDRVANACAARDLVGGPAIVVDFGTATTYDVLSGDGAYIGGAIAPGVWTATEALVQRTAKLPRIDLVRPASVIGTDTASAMQSGLLFGFAGQVDAMVLRIRAELGAPDAPVLATGGLAEWVSAETTARPRIEPWLTLYGIRALASHVLAPQGRPVA